MICLSRENLQSEENEYIIGKYLWTIRHVHLKHKNEKSYHNSSENRFELFRGE